MHVALNGWFWDQPHTGSGQYVRRLTVHLRRLAPDLGLTLILPTEPSDDIPDGVQVVSVGRSRSNMGKVWFEQRLFPDEVKRARADIVHVPYWGAPLSSPARLVTTVLDIIPLALPEYAEGWKARLYTSLVSATARGSAHIITISHAAKADIVQYLGIAPEMITVTHLAADDAYHPRLGAELDAEVRARYGLPDRFLLYLGSYDVRKNLRQLIDAYAFVSRAEGDTAPLVLAGKPPTAWGTPVFPNLPAYIAEREQTEFIQWADFVDEADKPSFYRLARAFIYPTIYEGFGLQMLESMASGTPVIANQIPVMEEISGDAAYLVAKDNERAMGGALLALLGQNPLHEMLAGRGLAHATNFSWRKTARETLAVYERVMGM